MTNATATDWTDQVGRRTIRALFAMMMKLHDMDDSMPVKQMAALMFIALNEGSTQSAMEKALGWPPSTISRNTVALSTVNFQGKPGLGLITMVDHPEDRRARLNYLTPKGRAFMLQTLASL